ncbi:MAG: DoxX family protein [Akkermansiaceae bacterium]
MTILKKYQSETYAIMRIVVGLLFACHGAQKLLGMFGGSGAPPHIAYIAGGIELVAGLMITAGFKTSIAAFLSSGLMAVGYFMAHQPKGLLPIQNGGELAVVYCFLFLYIAAAGNGIWSICGCSSKKCNT